VAELEWRVDQKRLDENPGEKFRRTREPGTSGITIVQTGTMSPTNAIRNWKKKRRKERKKEEKTVSASNKMKGQEGGQQRTLPLRC